MAVSIGDLVGTLSLNDQFSGKLNQAAQGLGIFGTSFGAVTGALGGGAALIGGVTAAIVALGSHGADVNDIQEAFGTLSERMGSTADVMLGELQRGTLGTISNFDLMTMANKALGSGMVRSSEDMGTLAAGAKLLADRTGVDTAQAFDTLTTAMASGRTAALKQIGVFVDSKVAIDQYRTSTGQMSGELTDSQRATALSQAALAALRREVSEGGKQFPDFADNVARGKVAVQNFTDNLSLAIAKSPVLAAGMASVEQSIKLAFGGSQQDAVRAIARYVGDFAIALTYVGQGGAVVATVLVTAWYGVKTVILGVITALAGVGTALAAGVESIARMAANVPGAADAANALAAGARGVRDDMAAATRSLAAETAEAARGVMGHSALHEKLDQLGGALLLAREAMEKAQAAQIKLGSTSPAGPVRDTTEAVLGLAAKLDELQTAWIDERNARLNSWMEASAQYQTLQDELTAASLTGVDQRLFQIERERTTALASLQQQYSGSTLIYAALVTVTQQKFDQMRETAQASFFEPVAMSWQEMATMAPAQFEALAARITTAAQVMGVNVIGVINTIRTAHAAATASMETVERAAFEAKMTRTAAYLTAISTILTSVFGKSKTAAIAGAIIDTAAAVLKALASSPPPLSYVLAAAAAAAGFAQIQIIRNQSVGFATGTPGTGFQDFGAESTIRVHGVETVLNKPQAVTLADMLAGGRDETAARTEAAIERLGERLSRDQRRAQEALPIMLRDAVLMGAA